ncbi:ZN382 protein, partial [Thryothorus ludovicianus]|nr:ZN382 protein [Thryothorus ludovicianus]
DTEGPLSHTDPYSKFTQIKEESHGGSPCAGGHRGAPDSTDTWLSRCDTLFPAGAWSGSDSKDHTGGRWESGSDAPRSGWSGTKPGGCAKVPARPVPAASGLLLGGPRGLSCGAGAALGAHPGRPYLCGICGKSFRHHRSLLAHKKLRRGAQARHDCTECGSTFCLHGD